MILLLLFTDDVTVCMDLILTYIQVALGFVLKLGVIVTTWWSPLVEWGSDAGITEAAIDRSARRLNLNVLNLLPCRFHPARAISFLSHHIIRLSQLEARMPACMSARQPNCVCVTVSGCKRFNRITSKCASLYPVQPKREEGIPIQAIHTGRRVGDPGQLGTCQVAAYV